MAVGIGASYLGPDFVNEALRTDVEIAKKGVGMGFELRFLSSVDPVDVKRATEGLEPEETMVIFLWARRRLRRRGRQL